MKNFAIGALLVIVLFFVIRPGVRVATSGSACSTGRFPLCADVNGDGVVDITDPVYTLNWLFTGGADPICCADTVQGPAEWVMNQAIPIPGRPSTGRFKDNGDGTVLDLLTGLEWQQRTGDWISDNAINDRDLVVIADANTYVKNLKLGGKIGWRLPTIRELQSTVDNSRSNPAIDPVFTDTPSNPSKGGIYYWSSTFLNEEASYYYTLAYQLGDLGSQNASSQAFVRAVRNP
jgi:Protein of unknown function (DUF1566)